MKDHDGERMAGKRALLIGGLGFIGTHLTKALLEKHVRVTIIARQEGAIPRGATLIVADAFETNKYRNELRDAEFIVNLVGLRTNDAAESRRVNYEFPLKLLEEMRALGAKGLLVQFGSRLEYGEQEKMPVPESASCTPAEPYGSNKLAAEQGLLGAARAGTLRCACYRVATVYGSGSRGMVNMLVETLRRGGTFTIHGDGSRVKDFIHVDDVAAAVLATLTRADACQGEAFNLGGGEPLTFLEAAETVRRIVGKGKIAVDAAKAANDPAFVADIEKIKKHAGWTPHVSFAEGIKKIVQEGDS